jgi:chromosome partitioning protein
MENRVMIEYLLQDDQDDGRYRLAKLLLSDEMADSFDVVLIDAPPRLTAGTVNAFCASTHLLVPTVYDLLSAEAVGTFLNSAVVLKHALNHGVDLLGIVGMLTTSRANERARGEREESAMRQVTQTWGHFFDRPFLAKRHFRGARTEPAYCDST